MRRCGECQLFRQAFDAFPAGRARTGLGLRIALLTDDESTRNPAVEAAFREADSTPEQILEHEPLGGADTAIFFRQVGVGAGVARQDRETAVPRRLLHGTTNIPFLENYRDAFESVSGRFSRNLVAINSSKGLADPLEEPRFDGRVANTADFPPEDEGQIAKVVTAKLSAGIRQAIGMRRAAPRPRNRRSLDITSFRQPLKPLPHRRSGHTECLSQFADFKGLPLPQEVHDGRIAGAGIGGVWLSHWRSHTLTVAMIGILTSIYAKNYLGLFGGQPPANPATATWCAGMTLDPVQKARDRPLLTDSGWFWALMFSLMSVVGIAMIAPKWDWRQRQLESRYIGREQAAVERQRRAAGLDPENLADRAVDREIAAPGRIVPTWTLVVLATAATLFSATMLWRERRRPA